MPHWLTDWLTDWLFQVPTKRSKHSGMIQAQQDTAHLEHIWHFCMCSWARKQALRERKIYIFTVALHVHVLMVKLLPLLQVILRNNGVTFNLIFFWQACEISMLFHQPGKFTASFCGFGGIISECVSPFSSICNRCWRELYRVDRSLQAKCGFCIYYMKWVL